VKSFSPKAMSCRVESWNSSPSRRCRGIATSRQSGQSDSAEQRHAEVDCELIPPDASGYVGICACFAKFAKCAIRV
jgi:hypothetical protein